MELRILHTTIRNGSNEENPRANFKTRFGRDDSAGGAEESHNTTPALDHAPEPGRSSAPANETRIRKRALRNLLSASLTS
jgi:hypothetical protein